MTGNHLDIEEQLLDLHSRGLYRKIRPLEPASPTQASLDGQKILLFCGNDYLGLSRHPLVVEAAVRVATEYGTGAGAARLISGNSKWHRSLEEKIAAIKKKEKALLFSAGYLANLGVLTALAGENDLIIMDKLCHASLVDGARLSGAQLRVFPHKNYERCGEILENSAGFKRRILVSDTVFSMDGDFADIEELVRLRERYDCLLVMDDAHGTGVLGSRGQGACENWESRIDVITGTLSKAAGGLGGFAAASEKIVEYLINFARPFIFATALPPSVCAAAFAALEITEQESPRKNLWDNVRLLESELQRCGIAPGAIHFPIIPLIIGDETEAVRVSESLLAQGIFIPAVRTPTVPKGKARLRLTVSAAHKAQEIRDLAASLKSTLKDHL